MDLGRIKAHGISTTRTAWLTNPLRAMLWRLTAPFFQGIAQENDQRLKELAVGPDCREPEGLELLRDEVMSAVRSQLAGARKDAMAVAHRLSGLEEEAAGNEISLIEIGRKIDEAAARMDITNACIEALRKEVRSSVQALNDRIDGLPGGRSQPEER